MSLRVRPRMSLPCCINHFLSLHPVLYLSPKRAVSCNAHTFSSIFPLVLMSFLQSCIDTSASPHPYVPGLVRAVMLLVLSRIIIHNHFQLNLRSPSHLVAAVGSHVAAVSTKTTAHIHEHTIGTPLQSDGRHSVAVTTARGERRTQPFQCTVHFTATI